MDKVRVLIVDDSAFMRKLIGDFLSEHSLIEVVGKARNGADAIKKIEELNPDVVTLDVEMPVMNGLDALKIIMEKNPVPVIMLSSTTKEGEENTILAFQYGAVDFIPKPSGSISLDLHKVKDELIEKVLSASKVNLSNLSHSTSLSNEGKKREESYSKIVGKNRIQEEVPIPSFRKKIVCIGTSTGGPRALQEVVAKFPENLAAPVLVVQHMPPGFTNSLAKRLDSLSQVKVKEAEDGEIVQNGTVYIAPGGFHLKVIKSGDVLRVKLDNSTPPINGHRPSVDVLFTSVSKLENYEKIAVIMTGMGSDGANGLINLKKSGAAKAIAESKNTSIVYGMPKAAIATNLVDEVQDLDNIAASILKYIQ